jgi:hypothetical protein
MMMMTLKAGFQQPKAPVWGDRILYAPVLVEIKKGTGKSHPLPNWNYFLGFGHQFLMNASQTEDGVLYFCLGFSMSSTSSRDRQIIVLLSLAFDAKEKLTALHKDAGKVRSIMADVQNEPLRRYSIGALIPSKIIPRVVGTISTASTSVQRQFFETVKALFSPAGQLPVEYRFGNKEQVFS